MSPPAGLSLLTHGSYLERFSTCARKNCACHQGHKHGPRTYVVVYREGRQRQVYVPRGQLQAVRKGLRQHQRALVLLRQITDINLKLMRDGLLGDDTHRYDKLDGQEIGPLTAPGNFANTL